MRDRMEKLVLLPFTVGCVSEASVAVGVLHPRRSKSEPNIISPPISIRNKEEQEEDEDEDEEGSLSDWSVKGSYRFLQATPKPNISTGFHRLFKTFSQLFVYKEEMEEVEGNMEIGSPTDVKHVTHIGWDVSEGFDNLIASDLQSQSLQTSLNQFQLSMPNASS